jgi:integrase
VRIQLKHIKRVQRKRADGSIQIYHYHRLSEKRIHGEPGSPEFLASYMKAEEKEHRSKKATIERLAEEYKKSPAYLKLSQYTRSDYDRLLTRILEKFAGLPLKAFDDPRIKGEFLRFRDELALISPRQADYMWSVARRIVQWGIDYGHVRYNHLTSPGKLYKQTRAVNRWSPDQVQAFMATANPSLRLAMVLALHTGQRQGDLLALTWTAYDGSLLQVTQSKTGVKVTIPCTNALKNSLDAEKREALVILTTPRGLPWKRTNFAKQWRKNSRAAGIADLTFNDLRGTFITLLSEHGCTPQEISSISGHALEGKQHILDTYSARTVKMARTAIAKFENGWGAKVTTSLKKVTILSNEENRKIG